MNLDKLTHKFTADGDIIIRADAFKAFVEAFLRYRKALQKVESKTHSWVIREETAHLLKPIHDSYRDIVREALEFEVQS